MVEQSTSNTSQVVQSEDQVKEVVLHKVITNKNMNC